MAKERHVAKPYQGVGNYIQPLHATAHMAKGMTTETGENWCRQGNSFAMMGEGNERKNSGKRRNSSKVFKRMGLHLTPAALLSPLPMPSLQPSPQALEGLMHICLGKIWAGLMTWVIIQLLSEKCCWLPPGTGHISQQATLKPNKGQKVPWGKRDLWPAEDTQATFREEWEGEGENLSITSWDLTPAYPFCIVIWHFLS